MAFSIWVGLSKFGVNDGQHGEFSVYNDLKLSKADDGGRVFLASMASMSILTRQFVNGEGHGDSVMLQIHHDPTESRLDDQRVKSRGRAI